MRELDISLPELVREYIMIENSIDRKVNETYPKGKKLRWKDYKYKGRLCEIESVHWEVNYIGRLVVNLRCKTMNKKEDGFIDSNDLFHRTYWEVDAFEEIDEG